MAGDHLPVRLLSWLLERFGSTLTGRRVLRATGVPAAVGWWLRVTRLEEERRRVDSMTVLLGVRNRADHRLENALRSLRDQTFPADRLVISVVDYGSSPACSVRIQAVCERFGADYVRVEGPEKWSRSRCLNHGLRRVRTKFVLFSDVDIVFSPGYVEAAVQTLKRRPRSVVCAPMHDLPESTTEVTREAARKGVAVDLDSLRRDTEPRRGWAHHPSILATYSALPRLIGGYDEFYEDWGWEDEDLLRRLLRLGLRLRVLHDPDYYLHQWHPKMEGIPEALRSAAILRNRTRFERTHSILRNRGGAAGARSYALDRACS
jgi:GT2 family glycosyltransferase